MTSGGDRTLWYEQARAAWPSIRLDADVFQRYLDERPEADAFVELYLACACARGDRAALSAFEATYGPDIRHALSRMKTAPQVVDEVAQLLRQKLFVGEKGKRPRIAEYAGRGDLKSWLRVAAVRTALSHLRKHQREILVDDQQLPDLASPADPELDHMKQLYRGEFRSALEDAVASLTPRERNLLRQHFLDGLGVEKLATLYGVHTSTAARWLAKARERIVVLTKEEMMRRLQLKRGDVSGILYLIKSQLEISLTRLFKKKA
jgi:RNA polymerase sigma-70 factor, ECF subfamily